MIEHIRLKPTVPLKLKPGVTADRLAALVRAACKLLAAGAGPTPLTLLHRLDKADTKRGLKSIRPLADLGVPYPMLLYEHFWVGHSPDIATR